jgi:hypothetical protein
MFTEVRQRSRRCRDNIDCWYCDVLPQAIKRQVPGKEIETLDQLAQRAGERPETSLLIGGTSQIARQFGVSPPDVRNALASDTSKSPIRLREIEGPREIEG